MHRIKFLKDVLFHRYYGLFLWFPELFNRTEKYGGSPCALGSPNETISANISTECTNDVSDKIYLESFLTAVSNLPGNIITIFLIDKIGRKITLGKKIIRDLIPLVIP